ncbi:MAG TPA: hypothetical protein PLV45_11665 [bacterium]|nr:hypothetical protein [bacterium]
MNDVPRLFGTSGIRGIFSSDVVSDPFGDFVRGNLVTPQLARYLGRAVAVLHQESGNSFPVEIWQDVRDSGIVLARAVAQGLTDGGSAWIYRGIAPTTLYTVRRDRWVLVITASHNPAEFNGIKVFSEGRPLVRSMEKRMEAQILAESRESGESPEIIPELTLKEASDTRTLQMDAYRSSDAYLRLQTEHRAFLSSYFLPMDLAHGAAACAVDHSGAISRISPPLAIFLSLGIPVVGYGCTRDAQKTNERIGAAYAYGETVDQPEALELKCFAEGRHGYGAPADRILFWPVNDETVPGDSFQARLVHMSDTAVMYRLPLDFHEEVSEVWVLHIDDPSIPGELRSKILDELMRRLPLPGVMVDGDADRILITTPALAATAVPYLTGDGMIRFFIETAPPGTYSEVAFTVESGLALDVALERLARKFESVNQPAFDLRKVTVGDRAIIDCFMDSTAESCIGGEPSGHIVCCETTPDGKQLVDDPFMTYLVLLNRVLDQGGSLDNILDQLFMVIPEVFCARKPDSRAGSGLTTEEKRHLELWQFEEWGTLSPYAETFIPNYVMFYSEMVGSVFKWGPPMDTLFTDEWTRLLTGDLTLPDTGWEMPLATVVFDGKKYMDVSLYLDPRPWAGPEVIRIGFRMTRPAGDSVVVGEGVFRNSGTSPKNAGYHKLWPENPLTREAISEDTLIRGLKELAARRADFTNEYVENRIRVNG